MYAFINISEWRLTNGAGKKVLFLMCGSICERDPINESRGVGENTCPKLGLNCDPSRSPVCSNEIQKAVFPLTHDEGRKTVGRTTAAGHRGTVTPGLAQILKHRPQTSMDRARPSPCFSVDNPKHLYYRRGQPPNGGGQGFDSEAIINHQAIAQDRWHGAIELVLLRR